MEAGEWNEVIDGKRYCTAGSVEIANDAFWDGHNYERQGRNTFLFCTLKGNYFTVSRTQCQGERDALTPQTQDVAIQLWEQLPEHLVTFEEAFPGVTVEDA
jgi:uncharacterized membrane-anchored protein